MNPAATAQLNDLVSEYAQLTTRICLLRQDAPPSEFEVSRLLQIRDKVGEEISACRRRTLNGPDTA